MAQFGWCGSAALGGFLADRFDYSFTFLITAVVQGSAILIWGLLIPYVPRREMSRRESQVSQRGSLGDSLDKPLLLGEDGGSHSAS